MQVPICEDKTITMAFLPTSTFKFSQILRKRQTQPYKLEKRRRRRKHRRVWKKAKIFFNFCRFSFFLILIKVCLFNFVLFYLIFDIVRFVSALLKVDLPPAGMHPGPVIGNVEHSTSNLSTLPISGPGCIPGGDKTTFKEHKRRWMNYSCFSQFKMSQNESK